MENKVQKLFEGTTELCGRQIGIKFIKESLDQVTYRFILSELVTDESQIDYHNGGNTISNDLEALLIQLQAFKREIKKIKDVKPNKEYNQY